MKTLIKLQLNSILSKKKIFKQQIIINLSLIKFNFCSNNNGNNDEEEFTEVSQYIHENAFNIMNLDSKVRPTELEIKKQYRQLSLLVHPDKNQDERAADAFHGKNL